MKAKHTPGPWSVKKHFSEWLIGNGRYLIAETAGSPAYLGRASAERDAANARLLAAAPELLEALNAVEGAYQCGADLNTVMDQVKSAIAKANGESQ